MLIGDRSGLLERHTQLLYETGTAHLIAISGLHIGLIAAFGYLISKFAWSLTIIGMNFCPSRVVASILSMLCASWYAALSGFSLPTQRALLMVLLAAIFINCNRRVNRTSLLAYSLMVVLMFNPLVTLSAGFWMSYIAMVMILLALSSNILLHNGSMQFARIQIFMFAGLLPVSIYIFNQSSFVSFIANSVAIPMLGSIVLPVLFLALIFFFH